jgi:PAS domain S-box-containing protein
MSDLLTLTRDPRLAAQATSAVAAWAWASDGVRILWANGAAAALMDAPSVPALLARRFAPDAPEAAQIVRLGATLPQTGAPRLERLHGLMCICSRLTLRDGTPAIFVLASEAVKPALPLAERAARLIADAPVAAFTPDGALLHAPDALAGRLGDATTLGALGIAALAATARDTGHAEGESRIGGVTLERIGSGSATVLLATFEPAAAEQGVAAPEAPPADALDAVAEELRALQAAPAETQAAPAAELTGRPTAPEPEPIEAPAAPSLTPERRHPLRFVWQMDAETRFTLTSPEFMQAAGAPTAAVLGQPWAEIAERLALDPEGQIARAVASHDTWSGIVVAWPIEGNGTIDVELSGLPVFDRDRSFRGYRGFGVCRDVTRLSAAMEARRDAPAASPAMPAPADPGAAEPVETAPASEPVDSAKAETPAPEARPLLTVVPAAKNVVPFRGTGADKRPALTPVERTAFNEIAETLGGRVEPDKRNEPATPSEPPLPARSAASAGPLPSAFAIGETATPAAAETETRKVLDRLPVAVLIHRNEVPLYANRTFLEWTGFADLAALTAAGGLERLIVDPGGALDKANGTGKTFSIATRGGDTLTAEGRLYTVPWMAESAFMLVLIRTAADDRLRASQHALATAETEARELKSILDTATDGIVVVDRDGRVLSLNRSAEALFGYDSREVALRPFTELFAPESERAARDYLDGLAQNGVASLLNDGREVIGRVRQGGLIPLFMTMGRVSDGANKFCAVFRDITQWKRAEEDLLNAKRHAERASSAKSDFLAKISHEIRTPLNAIIGFSEVMMEERFGPVGSDRYREYLKDIHASGGHLVSLINDLLDLSKIEAGKLDLTFASVNLNELVQQCVALMQPQANRERIIIRSSLSPALPAIVADARSVRQIVLNLLSNSIKFTGAGGQVIISSALTERGEAVMRVRDTGIGMSEKEIETAMEPFRQLATSTRWGSGGTGLGLPLTKALAEANRATFAIKSAVNSGTLVEITFPATRVLAE